MDGEIDGWRGGQKVGWKDEGMDVKMNEWVDGCKDGWTDGIKKG
jgi:hypothetical protein